MWSSLHLADGSVLLGSRRRRRDLQGSAATARRSSSTDARRDRGRRARRRPATAPCGPARCRATSCGRSTSRAARRRRSGARSSRTSRPIWSLAAAGNTVYAGTGPSGKLFAITRRHREGGVRHRRQAHHRAHRDERRRGVVRHLASARSCSATTRRTARPARWPTSPATRSRALAPYRDGVVVAANDLAETAAADRQDAARRSRPPRSRPPRRARPTKAPDVGTKPGADKDPSAGHRPRSQGREEGQGRAVPRRQRWPARSAARADRDVLHVGRGRARRRRLRRRRRQGPRSTWSTPTTSVATAFDVDERSVAQLWLDKSLVGFATDDAAALYRATGRAVAGEVRRATCSTRRPSSKFGKLTWIVAGQGQDRDPQRQHREAGRRLERVAGAARRSASSAAATRAARSRARPAATSSSAPRSRTIAARRAPRDGVLRAAEHGDRGPGSHGRDRDEGDAADAQGLRREAAQPGAEASSGRSRTPTATTRRTRSRRAATARRTGARSRPARRR